MPASTQPAPRLVGGVLALDFVNTVDPRHAPDRRELLPDYSALVHWAVHAGALDARRAAALSDGGGPRAGARVHRRALALREALYGVLTAGAAGDAPPPADLAVVGAELRRALGGVELVGGRDGFAWRWAADDPEALLGPILASADELLRSPRLGRVRECPGPDGCGWLFLDTSKNGTRRWCSMEVCGNRAKTLRHRARRREA